MFDDTYLVSMVIDGLVERYGWTYEEAIDHFYKSEISAKISDERTGLFTCAPREILELFAEESEKEKV